MTCFEEIHYHHHHQAHLIHHFYQGQTPLSMHVILCRIWVIYPDIYKPDETHLTWTKCDRMTRITQPGYNPDVHMFVHLSPHIMDYIFI